MSSQARRLPFTGQQLAIIILTGWAAWFAGALLCRLAGEMQWFDGGNRILFYIALVPGTVPLVMALRRFAKLPGDHIALAAAIATAAAMMLDGIGLAWFPGLYGPGSAQTAASGAVILWGAAVAIGLGCWFNRAPR